MCVLDFTEPVFSVESPVEKEKTPSKTSKGVFIEVQETLIMPDPRDTSTDKEHVKKSVIETPYLRKLALPNYSAETAAKFSRVPGKVL